MAKRFTNYCNVICLFGVQLVPRPSVRDAAKRAAEANEKFVTLEHEALCVKFGVPFSALAKWLQNNS